MKARFSNRWEAGRELAERLAGYAGRKDVVALALPRGGTPIAREIAIRLGATLDVMIVRKLGLPWQQELAMGAIASGGYRVINADVMRNAGVSQETLDNVISMEERELERREKLCRNGQPAADLRGKVVILADDGIATGATMRVAAHAARAQSPARLIVAAPVAPPTALREFEQDADEVVTVLTPEYLSSIGEWYDDFAQLTDEEMLAILAG